ncbi:carbohydrate porin [Thiothrix litoralis]|uniref:Carbohydrate porin n=1 Tax=Thiothrix litoralis TaxID=2891210 RepID=A0ABX7X157_9GAMM|nr:carbohydrate porin [Thiothrix litoralis]QTR47564.1 carbohydrate porin [Thiothrix litoralis]
MKTSVRLSVVSSLAVLLMSAGAMAADAAASPSKTFTIGGDVQLDITADDGGSGFTVYNAATDDASGDSGGNFTHGGRIKLNAVGEIKGEDYFIKGVAQPLVPFQGNDMQYEDVYLQMGREKWDAQIGRFEAFNLFPLGNDTLITHAGAGEAKVYEANKVRGRKDDVLHVALHSNPSDQLKLEMGLMANKTGSNDSFTGVRPALQYKVGNTTLHAGFESVSDKASATTKLTQNGIGLGAAFKVGTADVNASVSRLKEKSTGVADADVTSFGVNMKRGGLGGGWINSTTDNGAAAKPKVNTLYATYTVPLFSVKDATVTFAANTSQADNVVKDDKLNAVRMRFDYAF